MPSVKKCPSCGSMNVGDVANCMRCQAPLAGQAQPAPASFAPQPQAPRPQPAPQPPSAVAPAASSACPYCRAAVPAGNSFCVSCGRQLAGAPAAPASPPAWQPPPAPAAYAPAPAPAWQPAPAPPVYGYAQQFANNSGTGVGPVPPEVPGWSWGAFFFSWLWGVANGVWVSLLIAMLGFIGSIWLGLKGNEMAWQKRRFDSVDQFKSTQRAWATWGWVLFFINLVGSIIAGVIIAAMVASGEIDLNNFR